MGVACDVIAPSLIPVRAGDRVKTDKRDAKKLVTLFRAGLLRFVAPPTVETEGLRDLLRRRDDLRCARTAARNRVLKQLLRHHRIYRDGTAWTKKHRAWVNSQRLEDQLSQFALQQALAHLDGIEHQLDLLDQELSLIAGQDRWVHQVRTLCRFRGISSVSALGLIAEIGDFARFSLRESSRPGSGSPDRVLLWRVPAPRAHHQGREHSRPPAAGRNGLALPPSTTPPKLRSGPG